MGKWELDLCVDNIIICKNSADYRRNRHPCKWESVSGSSNETMDELLKDLICCNGSGSRRRPVCEHVKDYIKENFVAKSTITEPEFSFSESITYTHGGLWYGRYISLPHGSATVYADTEDEAITKALVGLRELVDLNRNYGKGQ